MSKPLHWQTTTEDAESTEALAYDMGQQLKGGEVIELISDLGGGKTTFVRGLARGIGSTDRVSSPTYTVSKVYTADGIELHHFDFYRLDEGGMVAHELAEVVDDPNCIVVVEWGEIVHDVLPADRVFEVQITKTSESGRDIQCIYPADMEYVLQGVQK
jgi:tRNA threonylcarbamoyladenosine biosynthesis protein TsaE